MLRWIVFMLALSAGPALALERRPVPPQPARTRPAPAKTKPGETPPPPRYHKPEDRPLIKPGSWIKRSKPAPVQAP